MRLLALLIATLCFGASAAAAPRVAVDIAPLHSLTARVMEGIGVPDLILPTGASPHDHAMRPTEAAALDAADVVIRIGGGLTPWFDKAREALAAEAIDLELATAPGLHLLPMREGGSFGAHDHAHDGAFDPHVWLDPENGRVALSAIAETLAAADPENAAVYRANAEAARKELSLLIDEIEALLAPVRGRPYLVYHDAYQYFALRFDVPELGAVTSGDAERPGARRIAEIRALAATAVCVFAEPQFEPRLMATITEGTRARLGSLDPAGAGLTPGPEFYAELLRNLARDLAECLRDR